MGVRRRERAASGISRGEAEVRREGRGEALSSRVCFSFLESNSNVFFFIYYRANTLCHVS